MKKAVIGRLFILLTALLIASIPALCFADDSYTIDVSQEEYESTYKNDSHYSVVKQTTYYRYKTRTKETKQSGYATLDGYTKYDTKSSTSTASSYTFGTPISTTVSYTSTSKVTKSAVNSGYYYYAYAVANPSNTSDWTYYVATSRDNCISHMKNAGFSSSAYAEGRLRYFWYISSTDLGSLTEKFNKKIPYCEDATVAKGTTTKSGDHLYDLKLYKYNRCYKVKTDTVTNYFYRYTSWSAWSDWTTTSQTGDANLLQSESKVVYTLKYTPDPECAHEWSTSYTYDVVPTCTRTGLESIHCVKCNAIQPGSQRETSTAEHSWSSDYLVVKEATCEEDGFESQYCTVCNAINSNSIRVIRSNGHAWSDPWVEVEPTFQSEGVSKEICAICGETRTTSIPVLSGINIASADISDVGIMTYTGKNITPSPVLKYDGKKLQKNIDYTLSYSNNRNPGRAVITIRGKGRFTGTASAEFRIELKNVVISKALGWKKGFTARWKQATKAEQKLINGYQIRYSKNPDFKASKIKSTSKKDVSKVKIRKLKSKKTYYVQIRTYVRIGGRNYYSGWSPTKKVKTK